MAFQVFEPSICAGGQCSVIWDTDPISGFVQINRVCARHQKYAGNAQNFMAKLLDHERRVNYLVRDAFPKQISRVANVDTNGEVVLKDGMVNWTINDVTDQLEVSTTIVLTTQERNKMATVLAAHPEYNAVIV